MAWRYVPILSCALVSAVSATACIPYGADFGYPDTPPAPPGATVVTTAKGWDDDDPIRSLAQVVDTGDTAPDALRDFYLEAYPESEGWEERDSGRFEDGLCLVNKTDDDYEQVLDFDQYNGSRVAAQPDRYLVVLSRFTRRPPIRAATPTSGSRAACSEDPSLQGDASTSGCVRPVRHFRVW